MIKENLMKNKDVKSNTDFINRLRTEFSELYDEDKSQFDTNRFLELLKENNILELKDGYQLNFIGKDYARKQSGENAVSIIVPDLDNNTIHNNEISNNLFFTGDNLEVLRHLQNNYNKSINVIYIDPPYNTGSDGFIYPDKFEYSDDVLIETFGLNERELNRLKTIQGRSTHSAWLTFMYPRMYLSRKLLKENGVIFISIDDNEVANLKLLCNEIYGESNFIAQLSVENNPKGRKNSSHISVSSEHLLIYAKNINLSSFKEVIPKNSSDMKLDENGRYVHNSGKRVLVGDNSFNNLVNDQYSEKNYSVYYNSKKNIVKLEQEKIEDFNQELLNNDFVKYNSTDKGKLVENTYTRSKFLELFENNSLEFAKDKIYEKNYSDTIRMKSQLVNRKYSAIVDGKKMMFNVDLTTTGAGTHIKTKLFKTTDLYFDAPKNVEFIKLLIKQIEVSKNEEFIVMDFFAGSATTAEAVMTLNQEDGEKRQFIMVQLPEEIESNKPAYKAGYRSIDEISRSRIRKASKYLIENMSNDKSHIFDSGFKHYYVKNANKTSIKNIESFDIESGMFRDLNGNLIMIYDTGFDDMITPFSAKAMEVKGNSTGVDSILTTWMANDKYKFNSKLNTIEINDYTGYILENSRLYLIDEGWNANNTKDLLNLLGTNELNIQSIVIYGYSFGLESIRELELGIKQLPYIPTIITRY